MRKLIIVIAFATGIFSCKNKTQPTTEMGDFNQFVENYYDGLMRLDPMTATYNGDNRFNDQLALDPSVGFLKEKYAFYRTIKDSLTHYDYAKLSENDQLSFDIIKQDIDWALGFENIPMQYFPINQFYSLPLAIGQFASGQSVQPFKNYQDFLNWEKRLEKYIVWIDTAIVNMDEGLKNGYSIPKVVVPKVINQINDMVVKDYEKSLFNAPVLSITDSMMSASERDSIKVKYKDLILAKLNPAHEKLSAYLSGTYLPKARTTDGLIGLPNGKSFYELLVRVSTTTNKTPDEVYNIGLSEVARIKAEMIKTMESTGYKGTLPEFFEYMKTDPQFFPYKTPDEVLKAFYVIYDTIKPYVKNIFETEPKTPFEIKQTEAFRAASASAEYNPGLPDGSRPGVFYVPIINARKFNMTSGMESLFLHEAIPGHHYQISLQQENKDLPKFRQFGGNNAYVEGWALYCESLGKELGLYRNPYQYMGALGDEMLRAVRLVVDVAIHYKGMTREEAMAYFLENIPTTPEYAESEIERYMVIPSQALGYKIGALKIRELRTKYEQKLGSKFNLAVFHTQVLKDGSLPLSVLEAKLDKWAAAL